MKQIALVEDNPDNRLLVQAMLGDIFDITEYESGEAAVARLAENRPDLVLLDISMPAMDGPEVLHYIRSVESLKGLPVIALTAHAMAGDKEKYLEMGFDHYLTKPILDEEILIEAINSLLD
ncbi:MAG: response regulator [Candidatus Marinimicrobia bacterium]|nr:response regulator [Candidatus Neomarinimicrobiota bacterium]